MYIPSAKKGIKSSLFIDMIFYIENPMVYLKKKKKKLLKLIIEFSRIIGYNINIKVIHVSIYYEYTGKNWNFKKYYLWQLQKGIISRCKFDIIYAWFVCWELQNTKKRNQTLKKMGDIQHSYIGRQNIAKMSTLP